VPQSHRFVVAALGELVVDLISTRGADGSACLAPKPGGAPGNVAAGVARLGGRAAMMSKVGNDAFGRLLIDTLTANGVSTEAIFHARECNTSMAAVTIARDGEQSFLSIARARLTRLILLKKSLTTLFERCLASAPLRRS
jgi:sugar/nucleoside kinase (ribokinase family)